MTVPLLPPFPSPSLGPFLPLSRDSAPRSGGRGAYRGGYCQCVSDGRAPGPHLGCTWALLRPQGWSPGFLCSQLTSFCVSGYVCVQLFKGKFFVCQGEDTRNITNKSDCAEASYRWSPA